MARNGRVSRPDTPWHDVCPQGPCAYPHCPETGLYPAPKGRDRLREYFWFCLEHVREYNKTWNYYEGMAEPEIEAHIRRDTVWQRPTWPLGRWGSARGARAGVDIHDGFGPIFGEAPDARRQSRHGGEGARAESAGGYGGEHDRALAVLQLKWPVTITEIKLRYKALVKQLHPDANGGDKAAEEFLKVVNQAYSTLKNSSLFRASAAPGAHP
jgi:hypothetical protein